MQTGTYFQEFRVKIEILGDNIKSKEMTINTFSSHAILVSCNMPIACHFQSLNFIFNLKREKKIVKLEGYEGK